MRCSSDQLTTVATCWALDPRTAICSFWTIRGHGGASFTRSRLVNMYNQASPMQRNNMWHSSLTKNYVTRNPQKITWSPKKGPAKVYIYRIYWGNKSPTPLYLFLPLFPNSYGSMLDGDPSAGAPPHGFQLIQPIFQCGCITVHGPGFVMEAGRGE